jgi:hypothetical protein
VEVSETDNREVQKAANPARVTDLEEVWETYGEQLGWTSRTLDPAQATQYFEVMSRVSPAWAQQVEEVKAFVEMKHPGTFSTFAPKLAPNLGRVLLARARPRSRESRPQGRRTRSASASRDGPLPSAEDDPDEHLALLAGRAT